MREIWWEFVNWIYLAQDRDHLWALVTTVMGLQKPGDFLTRRVTVSFSGWTPPHGVS